MLSKQEEVRDFLIDFERASIEFLVEKGICNYELANEQLELKWKLLHTILQQRPLVITTPRNRITRQNHVICNRKINLRLSG